MSDGSLNPLFQWLYWVLDTPGIGAVTVLALSAGLLLGFRSVLRWIADGARANENTIYRYPTESLHQDSHSTSIDD